MAWTTPYTFVSGDPLTAAQLNVMQANLIALKAPPTDTYSADEASNWTTSSTSFTAIDGTDLSLSITTTGGDIWVHFHGNVTTAAGATVYFQLVLDGTGVVGDDGHVAIITGSTAPGTLVSFSRLITNVSAATHTILINWKVSASTATLYAGAGTSTADLHPQFFAREV